jgi:hypothetical protein
MIMNRKQQHNSISNIKFPMNTALIFKEQEIGKGLKKKRAYPNLITQYNILKGMIIIVTKTTNKIYIT